MRSSRPLPERLTRLGWWWSIAVPAVIGVPIAVLLHVAEVTHPAATVVSICALTAGLAAAATDLIWRRIPNFITYSTCAVALLLNLCASLGQQWTATPPHAALATGEAAAARATMMDASWPALLSTVSFTDSAAGAIASFLVMLAVYRTAGGGAGDVKLAAALGASLGLERGLSMLIWSYAVAGAVIVAVVVLRFGPLFLIKSLLRLFAHSLLPGRVLPPSLEQRALLQERVPLGPAFAVGTALACFGGNLLGGELQW